MSLPIDTGLMSTGPTSLLSDGTIVLSGSRKGQRFRELKQYNPHTGVLLNCVYVKDVTGNAEVKVDGRSTLALSFRYVGNIYFSRIAK